MFNGLINWFRQKSNFIFPKNDIVEAQAVAPTVKTTKNKTYLVDPSLPSLIIEKEIPTTTILPVNAIGESGGGYSLGTSQQQAAGLKQIINDALVFMSGKSPKKIVKWAATSRLSLQARAGKDINAYYDRSSLKFFYFPDKKTNKTIYACDSRTVVAHEFGHALLDILRPDLWNVMSDEIWAYHESFGDIIAILNNLQYEALIDAAIKDNQDLTKSNILTRLAAEMGIGLYNLTKGSNGELPNCLRDMSKKYTYAPPSSLPKDGRDDQIVNEPHSFSRVFTSMFYNLLIQVTNIYIEAKMTPKAALIKARDLMASYIMQASNNAPRTSKFFKSVCQEMMVADSKNGGKFQVLFYNTFVSWNIFDANIKILNKMSIADVMRDIHDEFDYQDHGQIKVLRVMKEKTIELNKIHGVVAQAGNPLLSAEIEVASQSAYYFNEELNLIEAHESSEQEIIETALNCISIIEQRNLIGDHEKAEFELVEGKLLRKKIASCGCNKPNYCIPGAPEYQKPWKPKNNSGCVKCGKADCGPKSCDCEQPSPAQPPKTGCYTSIKTGKGTTYKVGSRLSRKVC